MIFNLEFHRQVYYQLSVKVKQRYFQKYMAQNIILSAPCFMKQLDGILYQNKEENQERVRHGIQQKRRKKDKSQNKSQGWTASIRAKKATHLK